MTDKPILDKGESPTKFDAENLQTDREKRRDGIPEEDIRKGDWGTEPTPHSPAAGPQKAKGAAKNRKTRKGS